MYPYDNPMTNKEYGLPNSISILMLCKNKASYLRTGALSVIEGGRAELVLIEPGSVDGSREICEQLIYEFPSLVNLVTDSDTCAAEGLNNGLAHAKGSIVGVLNADDIYTPGALTHVLTYFESHPEIDVLLAGGFLINENTGSWKFVLPTKITRTSLGLSRHGSLTFFHQGMFYRRDRFPKITFNQSNKINWDKEFLINLFQSNAKIGYLKLPLAFFRINENSLTYLGFSREVMRDNEKYFDSLLNFNSNFLAAPILGLALRFKKAIRLVLHTTFIHSKKYIMSKEQADE